MDKNQNRMSSIYWKPRAEDIIQELWAALLISVLTALGGVLFYIYYQPFNKLMLAIGIVIFFVFILYFIYLFLSRRELLKIKSIIHKELGSSQLSLADLRKSISNICNILGIDKCTLYAQDKSNSDLILFFEHNTKIEYMRGLVRRSETSYQIWVKKVPWFTRNPAESDASKASAFRDREKIINSMAFPLKNGKVFGIVFFNYITQKKFFQYSGELKWIQRWGIIGNNPSSRYKEILEYFVDNLSFHLDLQRNLVDSPLTQVRKLSFFDRLYEILKSERYTDVLARHLLSGLVSNLGRLHCAIYLKKDTNTQVDSSLNINYEIVDSNVNFSQSLNFKKNYNFENVPNSKGILEHIHSIGGGAPFVCVTSHPGGVVEKMQLQLKKIFPNDVEAFMIFPIYGTDFKLYNKQNYDKGCFSRSQEKEEIPKGYIVVRGSSSIERFDDYTPMAFSLMSDYIGLILDNINSQNSKRLFEDVIVGLKNFEKHLNKKSNSWKEEVAPLLKLALHISGAQQADLWVYRSKIDKFYMAAAESSNTVIKLSDAVLQPRPNGNTFEIMRSGQNFFWPNTEGQNSLKPGANAESGIKALMGYPIEGLMNSFGVIWLRWDKKQEIEHFKEISKDLDVLFQYSGYLLSVSQPINEIEEISDKILSGARIILEPVLAKDLPASADYEEAVLLIKPPNTFNRQTIIEILRVAKENGCEFHGVRVFSGSELSDKVNNEKSRIEKHLGKAYNIAKGNEHITQIERVEINRVYNIDRDKFYKRWDCYPEDMDIIPALSLDISEEKITSYWEEGRDRERFHKPVFNGLNKIGESKSVLPIKEAGLNNGKPFFLLNGYLPGYKLLYTNKTSKTIAILLRWENNREQQELKKWRRLRESVFGDKNHPDECFPNSIRWRAKNETNFPIENRESVNGQKNIVHFSVSPLEAINDLNTWFDIKSEDTIYGRKLSSNPIDYELIWVQFKITRPIFLICW